MRTPEEEVVFRRNLVEIDAIYKDYGDRIAQHIFADRGGPPYVPPVRWTRRWWAARWLSLRWSVVTARRRVGLWIGGIDPSELEGE